MCLGMLLFFGWDLPQDRVSAVRLLKKVPKSHPALSEASYLLGLSSYYGLGMEEDESYSIKCFTQASQHGHAEATFMLGMLHQQTATDLPHHDYSVYIPTQLYAGKKGSTMGLRLIRKASLLGCLRAKEILGLPAKARNMALGLR